ncbi:ATP-binding protein [Cytophagales bacterium LB-30]|uniref:ATP-binding protein n=1 Tax=Shiella aurantiaca TaxID=3058365 RepID=A0ABT8F539_9BACT|nr:ATP-binding protein [Shiella aurantiaca]MDN4165341.1 ATP-binding protein [Shiella aurantiaca]
MIRKITSLALASALFVACQPSEKKQEESTEKKAVSFTKLWETDTLLTTCESVLVDANTGAIYVSNINGMPLEKDGNGFIAKIKNDGSIETLQWATGLSAPKGMAIRDSILYVTDIDRLVGISLASGSIVQEYAIEGAQFLNDVTTDGTSVYFSDMATGKIYQLKDEAPSLFQENVASINGLLFDNGNLLGLSGAGFQNLSQSLMLNDSVTGGDGLVKVADNAYVASRWQGEVYLIEGEITTLLLDTKAAESQTADIGLIADQNIVLIPTFFKNKVVAYQLEK